MSGETPRKAGGASPAAELARQRSGSERERKKAALQQLAVAEMKAAQLDEDILQARSPPPPPPRAHCH